LCWFVGTTFLATKACGKHIFGFESYIEIMDGLLQEMVQTLLPLAQNTPSHSSNLMADLENV
jgi:hypothetical protein